MFKQKNKEPPTDKQRAADLETADLINIKESSLEAFNKKKP